MASPFQTAAPFARTSAIYQPPGTQLPIAHNKLPNGVDVLDWVLTQISGPILNSAECELLSERLKLPSLPEMVFGKNRFKLFHKPSGFSLEFSAEAALSMVSHEAPKDIKVAASNVWSESNKGQVEKLKQTHEFDEQSPSQEFDWTFTTHYCGDMTRVDPVTGQMDASYVPEILTAGLEETKDSIPMDKLRSTSEPIIWFSHVHLFEDEIHDNGIAEISTKSRVMNSFWFCLVRFWLRVDGVMFRVIDHRLYHEFGSKHIIKEASLKEGTWEEVHLKVQGDLRKIRDPSEFAMHLRSISSSLEHIILPPPQQ
jgi:type 2A phosphatase activator TIP41